MDSTTIIFEGYVRVRINFWDWIVSNKLRVKLMDFRPETARRRSSGWENPLNHRARVEIIRNETTGWVTVSLYPCDKACRKLSEQKVLSFDAWSEDDNNIPELRISDNSLWRAYTSEISSLPDDHSLWTGYYLSLTDADHMLVVTSVEYDVCYDEKTDEWSDIELQTIYTFSNKWEVVHKCVEL